MNSYFVYTLFDGVMLRMAPECAISFRSHVISRQMPETFIWSKTHTLLQAESNSYAIIESSPMNEMKEGIV